jgi:hypothetical protein
MSEKQIIGKENIFTHYPDTLISALGRDRNSMVDSFVDEAVRFYCIMSVYPTFPVEEAIQLAIRPDRYKVEAEQVAGSEDWLVSITEVNE